MANGTRGFTIIELMIALLIVGVLVALAYPSFVEQVRKSRRADAIGALTAVQQAQERWRGSRSQYTSVFANTAVAGQPANGLGVPAASPSGYYTLAIPAATATEYVVTATAVARNSQALDGDCKVMGVRALAGNLSYGSAATSIDWTASQPDVGRCWAR